MELHSKQDALLDLGRRLVRRHGVAPLTATLTAAAVLASQAVTGLIMLIWQTSEWEFGLFLSTVVPLLAAPPVGWMLLGLVRRLAITEDKLERLSRVDPLTGVANRRHFGELADSALRMSQRYNHPLALLIIDIDEFKHVNERHGHGMGDKVLFRFARLCVDALRDSDLFGRFAGEEFVAALPHADGKAAGEVAERLRRRVEASPLNIDGQAIHMTVSIGVAVAEAGSETTLQDLYGLAASALNRAKANGRNRVEVADWEGRKPKKGSRSKQGKAPSDSATN